MDSFSQLRKIIDDDLVRVSRLESDKSGTRLVRESFSRFSCTHDDIWHSSDSSLQVGRTEFLCHKHNWSSSINLLAYRGASSDGVFFFLTKHQVWIRIWKTNNMASEHTFVLLCAALHSWYSHFSKTINTHDFCRQRLVWCPRRLADSLALAQLAVRSANNSRFSAWISD